MAAKCQQCQRPATVRFSWLTSEGPCSCPLCVEHANQWWAQFRNTEAGATLQIQPEAA